MYKALGSMSGMTKEKTRNYYQDSDSGTGLLSQHRRQKQEDHKQIQSQSKNHS